MIQHIWYFIRIKDQNKIRYYLLVHVYLETIVILLLMMFDHKKSFNEASRGCRLKLTFYID